DATYGSQVVAVEGEVGVTYESSNPDIISVNDAGQLVANSLGSAEITASFQGMESVVTLQVQPAPVPEAELRHRYSFNEESFEFVAVDSVGAADGQILGVASFTGEGEVDLVSMNDPASDGYVNLPNGIISALSNATFETWVTFDAQAGNWQRMFDFGNSSNGEDTQGSGTSYTFFT